VLGEMKRLLMSDHLDRAFADLRDLGLANVVWPEVQRLRPERLPSFVRWENAFATLMWLADSASLCETRLKAWKSPRDSQRVVDEQISATQTLLSPKSTRAQRLRALGQETYADTLILTAIELGRRGQRGRLDEFLNEYLSVANARGELPLPLLNGQDLIALGIAPGAQMGELLRSLYDLQLEGKIRTKDEALARIRGA
jgi:tRNA nucleotidyltransferase (CCA-adding enzyme)